MRDRNDSIELRSHILWLSVASVVLLVGCAGYQVGNQALYRPDIRTVHVPIIESESYRRFLGQQLTESVIKQIELDTPLVIANPGFADSVLTCRLVEDRKRSRQLDRFGEPRVLQFELLVEVDWVDRSGTPLMQRQRLRIRDAEEFIPEGGQSLTTAQQQLIKDVAQQIVGQMESPW